MKKFFIINVEKCTGCMSCVTACKDEFVDNDWNPYSKPQPKYAHYWIKVNALERGTLPNVKVTYIPTLCMHCDNPPCIKACLMNAIIKRKDGIVLIDSNKCNGCKQFETEPLCMDACPYNTIYFNSELGIAQKCTMCAHLLDNPNWKYGPRCYDACPTEAIIYGDENDPKIRNLVSKAEVLHPEYCTNPRVYYLNLPKPFISGCVVNPDEKEVIVNAQVTAIALYTGEEYKTCTDEFGDFWLKNLKWNSRYLIKIEKEGYEKKIIGIRSTDRDVNLGDICLKRK